MVRATQLLLSREQMRQFLVAGRGALHMSQETLAKEWGVGVQTIKRNERARSIEPIKPVYFWAMFAMLVDRGKLVTLVTDLIPRGALEVQKNLFSDVVPPSHWQHSRRDQ